MGKTNRNLVFRMIFVSWVVMWLHFFVRGLAKGEAEDYKNLFGKTLEEKRAYVTGKEFYEFIQFCKSIIPENSDYSVEANYDATMDYFRFAYYVYPSLRDLDDPEYIACYKVRFAKEGYEVVASLSEEKYVLKKSQSHPSTPLRGTEHCTPEVHTSGVQGLDSTRGRQGDRVT